MNSSISLVRPGLRYGSTPERTERSIDWQRALQGLPSLVRRDTLDFNRFESTRDAIREIESQLPAHPSTIVSAWREQFASDTTAATVDPASHVRTLAIAARLVHDTLDLKLYDEQLFAIWCLLHGLLIEMKTGEGKTLTSGVAAGLLASIGMPIQVITVNEYLVQRDAKAMAPLFDAMGLQVGCVLEGQSDAERRNGYAQTITYVSNKQIVFDYLRDRRERSLHACPLTDRLRSLLGEPAFEPVMRGLCCTIIDEADSVLVDDARTPCVLATAGRPVDTIASEAATALGIARSLIIDADFKLDEEQGSVTITSTGHDELQAIAAQLGGLWQSERFRREYVTQALTALHRLRADHDYLVRDDRILLIDSATGRVLPDRRLRRGLHRMLELKERVKPSPEDETVAAITVQAFFQRYFSIIGMSGTFNGLQRELRQVYGLARVSVPLHRPSLLQVRPALLFRSRAAQLQYLVSFVRERQRHGQPVLIGTRSVAFSTEVSEYLSRAAVDHDVLSARQDADEASVIAHAGEPGAVTVATNMAGRGTDIPLEGSARRHGGLCVLNLELNESRRIDRQLFGRAARQGNPGEARYLLSLEDELFGRIFPAWSLSLMSRLVNAEGQARPQTLTDIILRTVQWSFEHRAHRQRLRLHRNRRGLEDYLAIGGDRA